MNRVHPLIRVGGPILGVLILIYVSQRRRGQVQGGFEGGQ